MSEDIICVFSLSKRDPTFRNAVSINALINWLNGKKQAPHRYYFRSAAPNDLSKGSKILFSFDNQIFGEATVRDGIQVSTELDKKPPEAHSGHYRKYCTIDPDSIRIYKFHPTKTELLDCETFEDYQFSQLYSYLTYEQYAEITKRANR